MSALLGILLTLLGYRAISVDAAPALIAALFMASGALYLSTWQRVTRREKP